MAQQTDVNQLIGSVVVEGTTKEEYDKIKVVQELHPHLPIIRADADQLRQCLVNLMTNAANAMADNGGTLTISTRQPDAQHVEIAVSDMGMGLSIIYGIVKMHRGDIRVHSQEGKGSEFAVVLPIRLPDMGRIGGRNGTG